MNIRIANRLLEYRRANGYSQEELASRIGVSRQAVSKWERVEASPDTDNLIALAALYGVTIDELINGSGAPVAGASGAPPGAAAKNTDDADDINDGDNGDHDDDKGEDDNDGAVPGPDERRGKKNGADEVNIGFGGIHVRDKNGDEVHIDLSGVHIEDKNGEKVHINPGNVRIHDKDGKTVIDTKDGKICVGDEERHNAPIWFTTILPTLAAMAYLIIGFALPGGLGWTRGWLVFLLIPIINSIVAAVRKRKPSRFAYPVLVAGLYLLAGMVYSFWHPGWIAFLTIPIYYTICAAIERGGKSKNSVGREE